MKTIRELYLEKGSDVPNSRLPVLLYRSVLAPHSAGKANAFHIVADRFPVIRLINHHFLACWREIDPVAGKHRGMVSLMRRHRRHLKPAQKLKLQAYLAAHPALETIYGFKQRLCYLLLKKHPTRKQCAVLLPRLLLAISAPA